ncbi:MULTISPECIES: hypothetical protein [unclassified Micromonospora]|uniref:hypothetical protein n=1 Tax=unclassified Micromonospora TaxID=2617518 RepID=UPI00188E661A|nr:MULTISPECIES: hypothetical protein [unclassified Micromonospora]MBF5032597.1 hypothetical protein [Micromonospora sp. ANENR4]MCZ7476911.1 hypothetical protein [Micromonospora sp. WMMC273]WBC01715.1 hypothetical protein O7546_21530 [Micromonospora sp. WMMA1976]
MLRIHPAFLAVAVVLAASGCQGDSPAPEPSSGGTTAPASHPALEGVALAAWVCEQINEVVKNGTHGEPATMRPIAEAAKRSGVDGFDFKGSVLLKKADKVEATRAHDPSVVLELQSNALDLRWTCRGAVQRPGWPSSTRTPAE